MPNDLTQEQSTDQATTAEPGAQQAQTGGGEQEAIREGAGVQPGQAGNAEAGLGPEGLSPELEEQKKQLLSDYHAKTQKLAQERREMQGELERAKSESATLQELMLQPWFKQAMEAEKARRSGQASLPPLSAEQFDAAKQDPKAFMDLVRQTAESLIAAKVSPALEKNKQDVENLAYEREFDAAADRYADFKALNDAGALDPYLDKGYDFEAAYKQAKFDRGEATGTRAAEREAEKILAQKRAGAVEKPGVTRPGGVPVVKAKNFDEAFDKAWKMHERGITDFKVEK